MVAASSTQDGEYYLRVKVDSQWVTTAIFASRKAAEVAELAVHKIMVDYRLKRNDLIPPCGIIFYS